MTRPGQGTPATGIALALLSAGGFGTSGIFGSALISSGWSPAAVTMARIVAPAFLLAVPAALQLRGRWALLRRQASRVVVYGVVAVVGGQLFYFNAIESIPIGIALLLEYLGVVLVVVWLWVTRGERPRRLTVAGAVTAIAGLALLIGIAGPARLSPVGITWGLLDAVSLAAYFLISAASSEEAGTQKRLAPKRGWHPKEAGTQKRLAPKRPCRRSSWRGAGCASARPSS